MSRTDETLNFRSADYPRVPTVTDTQIVNRWMVQPNHANIVDTAHGGNVVKWMDDAGAMAAMRFAGETCVTARMNRVDFRIPIRTGDTALIEAYVYEAGNTSIKVRIRAYRENIRTGERELTSESYFVYVAIDEERNPTSVPELGVETPADKEMREEALDGESEI